MMDVELIQAQLELLQQTTLIKAASENWSTSNL